MPQNKPRDAPRANGFKPPNTEDKPASFGFPLVPSGMCPQFLDLAPKMLEIMGLNLVGRGVRAT